MERLWIWFKILPIENIKKINILEKYNDISKVYSLSDKELINLGLTNEEIRSFNDIAICKQVDEIMKYNNNNGVRILTIEDSLYPKLLKEIYNPPILLYYIGNVNILNSSSVSIFQGKKVDIYGRKLLGYISNNLFKDNIKIVSRFDEDDRKLFLNNDGDKNIIVLSSGIHEKLYCNKGVIITENEYYIKGTTENILRRNRILTGLAKELVIIQANVFDGVSYILDNALEQNREVWVVPGNINDDTNVYTNELLKHGVNVLTNYKDLLVYEQDLKK
ncbi:MAG: DNA-processing protein DprA [Clostridia bacterium]|nr:DNA-processing protein DprA [Clostridia bacterium]